VCGIGQSGVILRRHRIKEPFGFPAFRNECRRLGNYADSCCGEIYAAQWLNLLRIGMDRNFKFGTDRGRRTQSCLSFNHFQPCNQPELYAAVEIRESGV